MWPSTHAAHERVAGLSYIPAPKPKLPSHEESYNPPPEYLPTEEERAAAAMAAEADESTEARPFQPRAYDSLRLVPAYAEFIKERFERCLDLYLCPRTRRRRVQVTISAQEPSPGLRVKLRRRHALWLAVAGVTVSSHADLSLHVGRSSLRESSRPEACPPDRRAAVAGG